MNNISGRNSLLDVCRGIGMMLVIYAHAIEITFSEKADISGAGFSQWQLIYTFHMPLFFFVSGILHRKKKLNDVLEAALTLILIAVLTHVLGCLAKRSFSLAGLLYPIMTLSFFSIVTTWFLVAQAFIVTLACLYQKSNGGIRVVVAAALLVMFFITQQYGVNTFQQQAVSVGLLFYGLGFVSKQVRLLEGVQLLSGGKLVIAFGLLLACAAVLAPENRGCNFSVRQMCPDFHGHFGVMFANGRFGFFPLFAVSSIIGIIACIIAAALLMRLPFAQLERFLSWIGRNTLNLLVINGFFLAILQPEIAKRVHVDTTLLGTTMWALGLTATQILLYPLLKEVMNKMTKLCRWVSGKIIETVTLFNARVVEIVSDWAY